jgi:hypothetical protein
MKTKLIKKLITYLVAEEANQYNNSENSINLINIMQKVTDLK